MLLVFMFFFNDPATTEIYTLSLHDALPILRRALRRTRPDHAGPGHRTVPRVAGTPGRSEEHTSELQSHSDLVCRLLLEKKKLRDRDTLCLLSCERSEYPARQLSRLF